jgi:tRNA(adenine34) deaminase
MLFSSAEERDEHYMRLTLEQAAWAADRGEVPVGAIVVMPGDNHQADRILAQTHNQPIALCDPTAHAEILALRQAATHLGNYRLDGCTLYVTLEPCAMCAQALLHARVSRVVFGANEPRMGAAGSVLDLLSHPQLNHHTQVTSGVLAKECAEILQTFFSRKRTLSKQFASPLREDALRTTDNRFDGIWALFPDWKNASHYTQTLPALAGLRLHWLELNGSNSSTPSDETYIFVHGHRAWWPQWALRAEQVKKKGGRVYLPDMVGFGMSDKPKKASWHTLERHVNVLAQWAGGLGSRNIHWVMPPELGTLAEALRQQLARDCPELNMSMELAPAQLDARLPSDWREWPFPDQGHCAGLAAWKAWSI